MASHLTDGQHCTNSIVKVKGTLCEERIDEAYLQSWEADVAAQTAEEHGDGESGCDTEKKARGETANTTAERIADFRAKIAARKAAEGISTSSSVSAAPSWRTLPV